MSRHDRPAWIIPIALLTAAFAFRLLYGLSLPFWFEDERQVYLIGLKSFARGEWLFFGADVVWTGGQVPGALLGLLIRGPLAAWPIPEAPIVWLNAMSFGALAFFAWYLTRRLPDVPRWLIWSALLTLPWTLNFSTHVVNPSYVLAGAIAFFVGFFEGLPAMRKGLVPFTAAWMLMGAGLGFVMQIHMSWVLLPAYVAAAAIGVMWRGADLRPSEFPAPGSQAMTRGQAIARALIGFIAGAAITGAFLVPTVARYGVGAGHVEGVVAFQSQSVFGIVTTTARVLSLASFEINRFVGLSSAERLLVLWRQPWVVPFALVVLMAGLLQPLWMLFTSFRTAPRDTTGWKATRLLMAATVALIYASFFFSVRGPQAHSFYLAFPVVALFAFSCWQTCAQRANGRMRRWERLAGVVLVSNLVLHAGLAIDRWPRQSLYVDRPLVVAAITQRNDRYLGDRRDALLDRSDHRPRAIDQVGDVEAYLAAQPTDDLRVIGATWAPVAGLISRFSLTVANRGRAAAWLDLRYTTAYQGANGQLLTAREGVIKQILQPGETRTWPDIVDDYVPPGATTATITIVGAEKVIPRRHR